MNKSNSILLLYDMEFCRKFYFEKIVLLKFQNSSMHLSEVAHGMGQPGFQKGMETGQYL